MDMITVFALLQDGLSNGAIYGLLALSLVLVFTVTRVILIPQGEFVAYGALTAATMESGHLPATAWMMLALGLAAAARSAVTETFCLRSLAMTLVAPAVVVLCAWFAVRHHAGPAVNGLLSVATVTMIGQFIYRIVFEPLAAASTLTLLLAAIGVHLAMTGLGLLFFGPGGVQLPPGIDASISIGSLTISGQSICVLISSALLSLLLYFGISRTLVGKALMATAVNRLGARLSGISPALCGRIAFAMAAFIGAVSGLLISPIAMIYYDSGFLIGLKGFVAAIMAGLVSFPLAAIAALAIGIIESFASFTASTFKEPIVFLSIIPVMLLRSFFTANAEQE
jgi:branched-chain amino acid transport system permease protein